MNNPFGPPAAITPELINSFDETQEAIILDLGAATRMCRQLEIEMMGVGRRHPDFAKSHRKMDDAIARKAQLARRALDCGLGHLGMVQRACSDCGVKP